MCEECRNFAQSMVRSAQRGGPQIGARAATTVIPKNNFSLTRLPKDMFFTHACSRSLAEVQATDGFDPAYSSEICYNGDTVPHEHWFDRMTFAAEKDPDRWLSKVADVQGYGTDKLAVGGHQYTYEFMAPRGTIVRSTRGGFAGEVCFPEPIPFSWVTNVHQVTQVVPAKTGGFFSRAKPMQPRAFILLYSK